MKERRSLHVSLLRKDGTIARFMHIQENGLHYYCNCETMKSRDMSRRLFYKILSSLRRDGYKYKFYFGLKKGEYFNVHTGRREKIFGM